MNERERAAFMKLSDEVKRLRMVLSDMRNVLCCRCGKFKFAHEGACDGCRWRDV